MFPFLTVSYDVPSFLHWLQQGSTRPLAAAVTAFVIAIFFGHWLVRTLNARSLLDSVEKGDSERLDQIHAYKKTTPTLGGVIFIVATLLSSLLWARLDSFVLFVLLGVMLALGGLGLADDLHKLRTKRRGLKARTKLACQLAISGVAAVAVYMDSPEVILPASGGDPVSGLFLPFFGVVVPLGLGTVVFAVLVITGSSNAVNLTDGLDGLAAGCGVLAAASFAVVAYLGGSLHTSAALGIPHVAAGGEISVFAAALAGGVLGFLWFNCHPAQVFMGDTGALPLGGLLGLVAVMTRQEILLVLIGGVLVAEALSVMLQVLSFKLRGKRIFLIAPLHHHFQFKGWQETRVTVSFWIVAAVMAVGSLAAFRVV